MNKEEFINSLSKLERFDGLNPFYNGLAKSNGLVVVFGRSNESASLLEIRGAVNFEIVCDRYRVLTLCKLKDKSIIVLTDEQEEFADLFQIEFSKIFATYKNKQWVIHSDVPYTAFDICDSKGIVFSIEDM